MFGHKFRCQSTERVIEEIRNVPDGPCITFGEDSLFLRREGTDRILSHLREHRRKSGWGCNFVAVGFESLSLSSLEKMKKGKQTPEDIFRAARLLRKYNIPAKGLFVFGWDDDSLESIREVARFCNRERLTAFAFTILTPFCGTEIEREFEAAGRIWTRDWRWYDTLHAVYEPTSMTAAELQRNVYQAYHDMAGTPALIMCAVRSIPDILAGGKHIREAISRSLEALKFRVGVRKLLPAWEETNREFLELMARQAPEAAAGRDA
ncbi:MAG TPA: hypothetical protein PL033_07995 [Candidatus Brocadiia bacterium]|nr:hypothetical protein [Candidatus Brocadiia bacterium]